MKIAQVVNFKGMADDRFAPNAGEFAIAKHFDVLTNPKRLQPLRGMALDALNTGIGNIIVATNGQMYAVGTDPVNPTKGQLYVRPGYGSGQNYQALATPQLSGTDVFYDLLVDYRAAGNVRTIIWASKNLLVSSDPLGASSADTTALTFTTIGQGLVHPKDQQLYIPYQTSNGQFIAVVSPDSSPFGTFNAVGLSLPLQYRAYCLSFWTNYLAIPQTTTTGTTQQASVVYLWNRDTSQVEPDDVVPWGEGSLQVLNNLSGTLVGVSSSSANYVGSFQDFDSILIKIWNGGPDPTQVGEIKANHLNASGHPTCTINPRVNFVYKNRLYFSVTIDPGDGIQPIRTGIFSVGKNKIDGAWSVTLERMATNDGSETGVIAAAISGDFVSAVHTVEGTVTLSTNGQTSSTTYLATSIYESGVNPEMNEEDRFFDKTLRGIRVNHLPLQAGEQIVLKYRMDSIGQDSDWVTVYTQTTAGKVKFHTSKPTSGQFSSGRNVEWRIESTGGAVVTGYAYYYDIISSAL